MRSFRSPFLGLLLSSRWILTQATFTVNLTDPAVRNGAGPMPPAFVEGDTLSITWAGADAELQSIVAISCNLVYTQSPSGLATPSCSKQTPNIVATFFNVAQCTPSSPATANAGVKMDPTNNHCTYDLFGSGNATFALLGPSFLAKQYYQIQVLTTDLQSTGTATSEIFQFIVNDSITTTSSTSPSSAAQTPSAAGGASPGSSGVGTVAPSMAAPSPNMGLSTGAKVGIAVGIVGAALIALVVGALLFRRHRRNSRNIPAGSAYSRDLPSQHELQQEKEANLIHSGEVGGGAVGTTNARDSSYEPVEGNGVYDNNAGYTDRHVNGNGISGHDNEGHGASAAATGSVAGAQTHDRETPGGTAMSADERQRWDEEEARLDEAIAEAERRR